MSAEKFGDAASRLAGAAALALGWRPDDFWNATPAELGASLLLQSGPDTPDRDTIDRLMQRFPDR